MSASPSPFRVQLHQLHTLPPLPFVAQEILKVFADEDADIDELERIIGLEPALAARLIGLANSAYYGQQGRIHTLRSAIVIALGLKLVKDVALALAMAQSFRLRSGSHFSIETYWLRAVTVARGAALWSARKQGDADPSQNASVAQSYLAGLVHQLGIGALAHLNLEAWDHVVRECASLAYTFEASCEIRLLGVSHSVIGCLLAQAWHLPKPIVSVIAHYQDANYTGPYSQVLQNVQAACVAHDLLVMEAAGMEAVIPENWQGNAQALRDLIEALKGEFQQLQAMASQMSAGA